MLESGLHRGKIGGKGGNAVDACNEIRRPYKQLTYSQTAKI